MGGGDRGASRTAKRIGASAKEILCVSANADLANKTNISSPCSRQLPKAPLSISAALVRSCVSPGLCTGAVFFVFFFFVFSTRARPSPSRRKSPGPYRAPRQAVRCWYAALCPCETRHLTLRSNATMASTCPASTTCAPRRPQARFSSSNDVVCTQCVIKKSIPTRARVMQTHVLFILFAARAFCCPSCITTATCFSFIGVKARHAVFCLIKTFSAAYSPRKSG